MWEHGWRWDGNEDVRDGGDRGGSSAALCCPGRRRHGARGERAQRDTLRRHQHHLERRWDLPGRVVEHDRRPARVRLGVAAHPAAGHGRVGHVRALPARGLGGRRRLHPLRRPGQPRRLDAGADVRRGHRQPQLAAHPGLPDVRIADHGDRRRQRHPVAGQPTAASRTAAGRGARIRAPRATTSSTPTPPAPRRPTAAPTSPPPTPPPPAAGSSRTYR